MSKARLREAMQRRPQEAKSIPPPAASNHDDDHDRPGRMRRLLGFELRDFSTRAAFVRLMCRPSDPSSLGVTRIVFGVLMVCDLFQERQFANAEYKWGNPNECRFPLFSFLHPLPLQWMYVLYLAILAGACGLALGLFYRFSCLVFAGGHCYLFLLDKTSWNNHSYLYALCSLMFLIFDADRYCSLDGLRKTSIRNAHVPLWNYCLIRAQFFLVYFIAGLKKLDSDWVGGYSMQHLSSHWVFLPARYLMAPAMVDLWVVHRGGLFIDLFVGFFLFFDRTRPVGFVIAGMFHAMNSRMFCICMFPYMMLATMPLFCAADWPKRLLRGRIPRLLSLVAPSVDQPQCSSHCLYSKEQVKPEEVRCTDDIPRTTVQPSDKPTFYHKGAALYSVLYLLLQAFLPYSHFLTLGYNNWTSGLYGYSWDMMVHSWQSQHVRITYHDQTTGETGFISPEAWTRAGVMRWSAHADTVKQYVTCVASRLRRDEGMQRVSLHVDVWRSLNSRFLQRLFDPRVDLVTAEWHPFRQTAWVMPLLVNFSDWRSHLDAMQRDVYQASDDEEVIFVADFPGLTLENFVHEDFGNASIEVLFGEVVVSYADDQGPVGYTLHKGDKIQLRAGEFHSVKTVSPTPSSYAYTFVNTTERALAAKLELYQARLNSAAPSQSDDVDGGSSKTDDAEDAKIAWAYSEILKEHEKAAILANQSTWQMFADFMSVKFQDVVKSLSMAQLAVRSLATGDSFDAILAAAKESQTQA